MPASTDTIAAIATAAGQGGVGIVRLSGPESLSIARALMGRDLQPRQARYGRFLDADGETIDDGLALYFRAPRSYTGEDVVELQVHGSPVLLAQLMRRCVALGARRARPGEFTERAFLNHRMDLAQAEAVADLISAGSEAAARAARRSLEGEFSRRVDEVQEQLVQLRVHVEAALDFPEEEIDFLAAPELQARLVRTTGLLASLRRDAERGVRLRDGLHVVIVGAPNAGKSSLLNALAREERAIVTDVAGTTRDLLRETLRLDGGELTLVDTAGLRESVDAVEAEGIRRARAELARADLVLAVLDARDAGARQALLPELGHVRQVLWLHNKSDLVMDGNAVFETGMEGEVPDGSQLWLSAHTGQGLEALRQRLSMLAGHEQNGAGGFSARARHVEALSAVAKSLQGATIELERGRGELAAEELRQAQAALAEITGTMDADALLGRIFGSFCIGK